MLPYQIDSSWNPISCNLRMSELPSLIPPIIAYRDYFAHAESNPYKGRYVEVLSP